jgi:hypothetical protein
MQNKFLWNPFEHIYSINMTKVIFVHCCSMENSKKSKLEEFI